jgi:hypothetical protein
MPNHSHRRERARRRHEPGEPAGKRRSRHALDRPGHPDHLHTAVRSQHPRRRRPDVHGRHGQVQPDQSQCPLLVGVDSAGADAAGAVAVSGHELPGSQSGRRASAADARHGGGCLPAADLRQGDGHHPAVPEDASAPVDGLHGHPAHRRAAVPGVSERGAARPASRHPAYPTEYHWDFGDGTTTATSSAPLPRRPPTPTPRWAR